MPRSFYSDINCGPNPKMTDILCNNEARMWDGPAFCNRPKGHKVDVITRDNRETGEFHQEAFEGWVWDDEGAIG